MYISPGASPSETIAWAKSMGANCDECPFQGRSAVPPSINNNATLIRLGEGPGRNEVIYKKVFVGKSGAYLDAASERHGIPKTQCHTTNAVLCPSNRKDKPGAWNKAVACCRPRLLNEIALTESKTIAAMGARAAHSVLGKPKIFDVIGAPVTGAKFDEKGRIFRGGKASVACSFDAYTVVPMLHPAFTLRSPAYGPVFEIHYLRAWEVATNTLPPWVWPPILIEPSAEMLGGLKSLLSDDEGWLAVDVETDDKNYKSELLDIGFATDKIGISVPWNRLDVTSNQVHREIRDITLEILKSKRPKVLQNGQFDYCVFHANGIEFNGFNFDTLLAFAVVAPQLKKSLDFICAVEFHAPRWKVHFKKTKDDSGGNRYKNADPVERAIYNARDCIMTYLLVSILSDRLDNTFRGWDQFNTYMDLVRDLAIPMRLHGIPVDVTKFSYHKKNLEDEKKIYTERLQAIASKIGFEIEEKGKRKGEIKKVTTINPHKLRHIKHIFETLGAKSTKFSDKTGTPSYDADVLTNFCSHPNELVSAFARSILDFRRVHKFLGTYIEGMPMDEYQKVHPCWNVQGAKTGRWSSQDPNMMNVPKPRYGRDDAGNKLVVKMGLRDLFGFAEESDKWIVSADYSQLESRILALVSGDKQLLEWYSKNVDVHTETAKIVFQTDNPTSQQRELAKRARYAMHYGSSIETAWKALVVEYEGLPLSYVAKLFNTFERIHYGIVSYHKELLWTARNHGYVEAPLSGRRYHFYGQVDPSKCYNLPIQMTASDVINPAALRLAKRLDQGEHFLMQIHDDLTLEGPDYVRLAMKMKEEMERAVELNGASIMFPVDISYGKNWGKKVDLHL